MVNERCIRKEERSKQGRTNNKAKQHSTRANLLWPTSQASCEIEEISLQILQGYTEREKLFQIFVRLTDTYTMTVTVIAVVYACMYTYTMTVTVIAVVYACRQARHKEAGSLSPVLNSCSISLREPCNMSSNSAFIKKKLILKVFSRSIYKQEDKIFPTYILFPLPYI